MPFLKGVQKEQFKIFFNRFNKIPIMGGSLN